MKQHKSAEQQLYEAEEFVKKSKFECYKNVMDAFTKRFSKLRSSNNQSQKEMADELGVSAQAIGTWERGERSPDVKILAKIISSYKVSADYLLGLSDNTEPDHSIIKDELGLLDPAIFRMKMERRRSINHRRGDISTGYGVFIKLIEDGSIFQVCDEIAYYYSVKNNLHKTNKKAINKGLPPVEKDEASGLFAYSGFEEDFDIKSDQEIQSNECRMSEWQAVRAFERMIEKFTDDLLEKEASTNGDDTKAR